MTCRVKRCPWHATAGFETCEVHRDVEEYGVRRTVLFALVVAGAVMLVVAALKLVELSVAGGVLP